jgi:3'-phosphoadenosine 5'-phosphosulfate sulfotransferase (PAPS reductase)/FAD synthetase
MKILVSYSGGKDSQACLILSVQKYGAQNVTAVFCDTGWEHPLTYDHIQETCKQLRVELVVLKSKYDFVSLAEYKKRFPSTKARFCTEELKIKPMIDYVLSLNDSCLIIQGIRSGESEARAAMEVECMYFKHYFEPIETNTTRIKKLEKKLSKTKNFKKRVDITIKIQKLEERLAIGKEDPKYYTYRKKDVFAYCKKYDASILRPIKDKTAQEVIDINLMEVNSPTRSIVAVVQGSDAIRVLCVDRSKL